MIKVTRKGSASVRDKYQSATRLELMRANGQMAKGSVNAALAADLQRLAGRAFDRADWAAEALRRYHDAASKLKAADARSLRVLHDWMFVPPTLWPFNIQDVLESCLDTLKKRQSLAPGQRLVIELLPPPPDATVCATAAAHELHVQQGQYEHLVKTPAKYVQHELAIRTDPELRRQWACIKLAFDVHAYQDRKGVIRRTMGAERNLRPSFTVNLRRPGELFQAAFDAFCLRWNLYGMQHDDALPLKLAVNLTPHGTMIHIPAYWSLDPKRDIRWAEIAALHRTRVPGRQGQALAEGFAKRLRDARKLQHLDRKARRLGLKGAAKHEFLCTGLGWVSGTSPKRLSKLRAEFQHRNLSGQPA